MSHEQFHEPIELLSEGTKNLHRALVSLQEELEAVDWYQQRVDACTDDELRAVLAHNRDEEIEHAIMTLEWLRRKDPVFARNIQKYIGSTGSIVEVEKKG
jgi:ferritin-like protein